MKGVEGMALQVGELYGLLELDTGPFDKAIGGVKGKLGGLAGTVAKATAGIGVALAGAFGAAATMGVKANSDTEQFMATMEVLTGSTAQAAKELENLKKFAATTPFNMEDLKKGELTMRAVGVSTEKWRDAIGNTAAAFGSAGKSYTDVVDAIADAQTGELERLKEFGITKNMIVEYGEKELKKTAMVNAKGQIIDQEAFNDSILGIMNDRYDGMMDKQSKTMAGMIDTFKDFATQGLEVMSRPIFDVLKKGMDAALPALERLQDSGFFDRVGEQVAGFVTTVMNGFSTMVPYIKQFATIFQTAFKSGGGIIDWFMGEIVPRFAQFASQITNLASLVPDVFNAIRPNLKQFGAIFVSVFDQIRNVVFTVIGYIVPHIMTLVGMVVDWWKKNGTELLTNFQIVFNGILAVVRFVMPVVRMVIGMVFDAIKMIVSGALNVIMGVFRIFAGLFTGDWSKMWEGVKGLLKGAVQLILGIMSLNFFRGLLNVFKNLATGAVNWIRNLGTGAIKSFEGFVNGMISRAVNMVTGVLNWFRNMGSQAARIFGILRGFGESIFRALLNTIRSVVENIVFAVRTNFQTMVSTVRTKANEVWTTVKTVFGKVKTAITSPIDAAKTAVGKAIDGIKKIFNGLKLKLPEIKTPKFTIKNWSKNPVDWLTAMPTLGVQWNKNGGIFNGPTIQGLGEAGPEAIIPLSGQRMKPFAREIARQMGGAGGGGAVYVNAVLQLPDGRIIAEIAEPHIAEIQNMNDKKDRRGWGVY